jgi:uncharacterized protein YdaU (DUF1376 family)
MATAPAFQFYATDWRSDPDVSLMTLEEEGAYIRLLAFAWLNGSIPFEIPRIAAVLRIPEKKAQALWTSALNKHWVPTEDGDALVNPRQEKQRLEYEELREKRRKAGQASADARANK